MISFVFLCGQDAGGMHFCNTCSQPLCGACRESTHRARMFSHHEIVSLAKRSKAKHRKCCECHLWLSGRGANAAWNT